MKTINLLSGLVLLTGITLSSCSKSHFNAANAMVNFKIQATSKIQPVSRALLASSNSNLSGSSFEWDTCLMVVSKIELEAEKEHGKSGAQKSDKDRNAGSGNDGDSGNNGNSNSGNNNEGNNNDSSRVKFEWTGPKKVDLFNLSSVLGGVTVVPGMFDNVTIKIESFKSDAGASPSFYLTGNYKNTTGTVNRINIVINEDFEFRIQKTDTLNFANDFTSIIKMNLVLLLNGVTQTELDNATLTNGKLVISSTANAILFEEILKNFHESGESEFERN